MRSFLLGTAVLFFIPGAFAEISPMVKPQFRNIEIELFTYHGLQVLNAMARYEGGGAVMGEVDTIDLTDEPMPLKMFYLTEQKDLIIVADCTGDDQENPCSRLHLDWVSMPSEEIQMTCDLDLVRKTPTQYEMLESSSCDTDVEVILINNP
ncbi:MAG: hypothetical protein H6626_04000 [Pseudobdellovibrionaceae bacterium]|nr:hypothetical protein [Bdellovibrionales bacterium]USN48261.1 MAG: hypothetical protein H6626_04000 [Pseudobdellovibrionaceae bacterium]